MVFQFNLFPFCLMRFILCISEHYAEKRSIRFTRLLKRSVAQKKCLRKLPALVNGEARPWKELQFLNDNKGKSFLRA